MTSSAKLDEMLSFQKSASDRTSLGYDFSSPSIASTSITVFIHPANNVEIENNDVKNELVSEKVDKGKSIFGAPPKLDKKEIKNPRAKRGNSQKLKQKKQHFCHHCGAASHTRPNCYKWLATQEQQHDCVGRPEPVSILFCSSWRSSQNPYVPFELEWFQFFPLTAKSRVC